jgi:hypothetical protein
MQLMPATAARFGVRDIHDPDQNIAGGTKYLRFLLDRFGGDVDKALAGYNAGEGAVDKYKGIPPYQETRNYVRSIRSKYAGTGYTGAVNLDGLPDSLARPAPSLDNSSIAKPLGAPAPQPTRLVTAADVQPPTPLPPAYVPPAEALPEQPPILPAPSVLMPSSGTQAEARTPSVAPAPPRPITKLPAQPTVRRLAPRVTSQMVDDEESPISQGTPARSTADQSQAFTGSAERVPVLPEDTQRDVLVRSLTRAARQANLTPEQTVDFVNRAAANTDRLKKSDGTELSGAEFGSLKKRGSAPVQIDPANSPQIVRMLRDYQNSQTSMQAAPPPTLAHQAKEAILEHAPGLASLNTEEGIKTTPAQEAARNFIDTATLGAIRLPHVDPASLHNARERELVQVGGFAGNVGGVAIPFGAASELVQAAKAVPSIAPLVASLEESGAVGRALVRAGEGATTFGGIQAGRELTNIPYGESEGAGQAAKNIAREASLGGVSLGLTPEGASPLRQAGTFAAAAGASDLAQGRSVKDTSVDALKNLLIGLAMSHDAPEEVKTQAREVLRNTGAAHETVSPDRNALPTSDVQPELSRDLAQREVDSYGFDPQSSELPPRGYTEAVARLEEAETPHHSNYQPRRQRGDGKGQFKRGKPEIPAEAQNAPTGSELSTTTEDQRGEQQDAEGTGAFQREARSSSGAREGLGSERGQVVAGGGADRLRDRQQTEVSQEGQVVDPLAAARAEAEAARERIRQARGGQADETLAEAPRNAAAGAAGEQSSAAPTQPAVGLAGEAPRNAAEASLTADYNRASSDRAFKNTFRDKYQSTRFDTENAVERRMDARIPPDFRTHDAGTYDAYKNGNTYLVYPRFGTTLEHVGLTAGAMQDVYDFPDIPVTKTINPVTGQPVRDTIQAINDYKVSRPAIFTEENGKWNLVSKGEIRTNGTDAEAAPAPPQTVGSEGVPPAIPAQAEAQPTKAAARVKVEAPRVLDASPEYKELAGMARENNAKFEKALIEQHPEEAARRGLMSAPELPTKAETLKAAKVEKVDTRTGLKPTQKDWLADRLVKVADRHIEESGAEDGAALRAQFAERGGLPKDAFARKLLSEPETIKVPDDGEFTIQSAQGANKLHQKITGKPIEGFERAREASKIKASSASGYSTKGLDANTSTDSVIQAYGGEEKALAAMQRLKTQLDADPKAAEEIGGDKNRVESLIHDLQERADARRPIEEVAAPYRDSVNAKIAADANFEDLRKAVDRKIGNKKGKDYQAHDPEFYLTHSNVRDDPRAASSRRISALQRQIAESVGVPVKSNGYGRASSVDWFAVERAAKQAQAESAPALPKLTGSERAKYEQAKTRLKKTISADTPHDVNELFARSLPDLAIIGKYHVLNGAREFKDFSREMINEFGEAIRPHLEKLHRMALDAAGIKSESPATETRTTPALKPPDASAAGRTQATPPSLKPRAFPVSAEQAGMAGGEDRSYEGITNKETYAKAQAAIEARGLDFAASDLASRRTLSADDAAQAVALMKRYTDAGDHAKAAEVAGDAARKLTEAGQAVQAASMISRLSPEGVLLAAQRQLKGTGKTLSAEQSESLTTTATKLREAESKVSDLTQQLEAVKSKPASARPKLETLQDRLSKLEQEARTRLEQRKTAVISGSQAGASTIPLDIADYAIIGASKLARKGITFAQWTQEMTREFGDEIKPHLKAIYKESYQTYDAHRKELRVESQRRAATQGQPADLPDAEVQKLVSQRLDAQTEARRARQFLARQFADLNKTPLRRGYDQAMNALGLARAMTTLAPFHAAFRHGKMGLATHPTIWARSFVKSVEALKPSAYERLVSEAQLDPDYNYARKFGLALTGDFGQQTGLAGKEEAFQSNWVRDIPGIKHSGQSFETMLNTLRLGWFKKYMENAKRLGLDPNKKADEIAFKQGAELVNAATGRASLPKGLDSATPALNNVFFSTRFWASRLKMLSIPFDPKSYAPESAGGLSRSARVESFKTLFNFTALVGTQLALAKLSGANVSMNPDDPDFLKAHWGNFHLDLSAGMQGHIKTALRLAKAIAGNEKQSAGDILGTYVRNKEAPIPKVIHDVADKKDSMGKPAYAFGEPGKGAMNRVRTSAAVRAFTPMMLADAVQGYKESGMKAEAAAGAAKLFGEGGETYAPTQGKGSSIGAPSIHAPRPPRLRP